MSPQEKAESLGVRFTKQEPGYLAMVVQTGNLLITSGHVSDLKGKLGAGTSVEDGKKGARECAEKILNSIWNFRGTPRWIASAQAAWLRQLDPRNFTNNISSSTAAATCCTRFTERPPTAFTLAVHLGLLKSQLAPQSK